MVLCVIVRIVALGDVGVGAGAIIFGAVVVNIGIGVVVIVVGGGGGGGCCRCCRDGDC